MGRTLREFDGLSPALEGWRIEIGDGERKWLADCTAAEIRSAVELKRREAQALEGVAALLEGGGE